MAVLAGLGDALRDVWAKKISADLPHQLVTWSFSVFSLPFLIIYCWGDFIPKLDFHSGLAILVCICLHCFGGIYLVKALAASDISLSIPMVAFTPVWLLLLGPFVREEPPSIQGVIGASLVVLGSYLIKAPKGFRNVLTPFVALMRERGPRIMLILSLVWSITSLIDRTYGPQAGIKQYALVQMFGIVVAQGIVFWRQRIPFKLVITKAGLLAPVGIFNALSFLPYLTALAIAPTYYVVSAKRSSILFSVILGALVFKERKTEKRLGAALIMFVGVVLISLSM